MAERGDPIEVGVRQLRGKLSDYLRQAQAGAQFVIVSHGKPVAELGAPGNRSSSGSEGERPLGLLRGKIDYSDEWDDWPEDFLDSMEEAGEAGKP